MRVRDSEENMTKKAILKGTYCLLIHLKQNSQIKVGKIGEINFKRGYYMYVGSALNSLEARIKRHLRDDKKLFWHVDYLLAVKDAEIDNVQFAISNEKFECDLASQISKNGTIITGFGCSDCKCESHLFYFKDFLEANKTCHYAFKKLNLKSKNLEDLKI
jgi:Uri superfamily endonuclease